MKHSQHDTNEEFKWDGDTLETKGGYRAFEIKGVYRVYPPNDKAYFLEGNKMGVEALIRQHMHEQNMANPLYIDLAKKFVEGEDWNGFEWGEAGGWIWPGFGERAIEFSAAGILMKAHQIVNGEIDDPRREQKQPECATCKDYGIVPIPGGEPDDMAEPEPCPDCQPAPAPKKTQLYAKHKSGFMFPIDHEGEKCYHFWLGDSDSRSFVQLRKSDCEVVEVPCDE